MISRNFFDNRRGNFGLTLALLLPFILGALGMTFDYIMLTNKKRMLQGALDSASLSSVSALAAKSRTTDNIETYAKDFLEAELAGRLSASELTALKANIVVTPNATTVGTKRSYTVSMNGSIPVTLTPFSKFIGRTSSTVRAASSTTSVVMSNALSVYLVVDRSGSMSWITTTVLDSPESCQNYTKKNWGTYPGRKETSPCYLNKMGSLKNAATDLFDELDSIEAMDANNTVVRSGTVSFNDAQQAPSDLAWGTSDARSYISRLPAYPDGGTDMTDAMNTAYNALTASSEISAHSSKSNTSYQKFLILMTDGENTGSSPNWNPELDDETLTTCAAARDAGITIYTVAYMAPENGKSLLLNCSGNANNSYEAEDADSLTSAFEEIAKKISTRSTRITG